MSVSSWCLTFHYFTRYWEVAFDEKKQIIDLLDEVTNKEYQNSIRLLHAFYKDASMKKTKDLKKLDPNLLAQLPPDKLRNRVYCLYYDN